MKNKKNLTLFVGLMVLMSIIAGSAHLWVPQLLKFVGTNTNLIQGLADLIQILLWVGILLAFIVRLYLDSSQTKNSEQNKKTSLKNINTNNKSSSQATNQDNEYSAHSKNITGLTQGENNKVNNNFSNSSQVESSGKDKKLDFQDKNTGNQNSSESASKGSKYSVHSESITGFVQGEDNTVTNEFKDSNSGEDKVG